MKIRSVFCFLLLMSLCFSFANAEPVKKLLNYQAYITNNEKAPLNGEFNFTFQLYATETGGLPVWAEIQTLNINNGLLDTALGINNVIPQNLFEHQLYLQITVENEDPMTPRQAILPSAYALELLKPQCQTGDFIGCYDGPAESKNVGECKTGERTCSIAGVFGQCIGQVLPQMEIADNKDNNCNGIIDDGIQTACTSNSDCSANQFCEKAFGQCGGFGSCESRPLFCADVYMPVCGCNGQTYGNPCEAAAAGVNVVHDGAC